MTETAAPPHRATKPSERVWEIDCFVPTEHGLLADPLEVDRGMAEVGAILRRIGGVVSLASLREEIEPGRVVTTKILVRHQTFVPLMSGVTTPAGEEPLAEAAVEPGSNGDGGSGE